MADIKNPKILYTKAALFVALGVASGCLLLLAMPSVRNAILLSLCVWAFARAYFFAFYVIEHYIDRSYRFSGLIDFVKYVIRRG